jgi:DNA-binding CsgD family transcriptional regulator
MVGFTALFVSLAIAFLCYQRTPFRWLKNYLILIATQAVFDLSYTFVLFTDLFSGTPTGQGHPLFQVLRVIVSLILVYVGPRFVQQLLGRGQRKFARLAILAPVAAVVLGYVATLMPIGFAYDQEITALYYAYIGGWFLRGLLQNERLAVGRWRPWIVTFLSLATAWYALSAVEMALGPVLLVQEPEIHMVVLSSSLFSVLWSLVVVVPSGRCLTEPAGGESEGVPEPFIREFDLSKREAEVLELLCLGLSNRAIGEKLYISPRTVENHVYNLYRKCGVSRRLELCNLLNGYR